MPCLSGVRLPSGTTPPASLRRTAIDRSGDVTRGDRRRRGIARLASCGERSGRCGICDRADRGEREARANGASRDDRDDRDDRDEEASEERISLGVLPPSIGAPETDVEEDEAPKPRRRARKPRTDGDSDETSPAA